MEPLSDRRELWPNVPSFYPQATLNDWSFQLLQEKTCTILLSKRVYQLSGGLTNDSIVYRVSPIWNDKNMWLVTITLKKITCPLVWPRTGSWMLWWLLVYQKLSCYFYITARGKYIIITRNQQIGWPCTSCDVCKILTWSKLYNHD